MYCVVFKLLLPCLKVKWISWTYITLIENFKHDGIIEYYWMYTVRILLSRSARVQKWRLHTIGVSCPLQKEQPTLSCHPTIVLSRALRAVAVLNVWMQSINWLNSVCYINEHCVCSSLSSCFSNFIHPATPRGATKPQGRRPHPILGEGGGV